MSKIFPVFVFFFVFSVSVFSTDRSVTAETPKAPGGIDEDMIGQELTQADVEDVTLEDGDPELGLVGMDDDGNLSQADAEQASMESGSNKAILDTVAGDETVTRADAEAARLEE